MKCWQENFLGNITKNHLTTHSSGWKKFPTRQVLMLTTMLLVVLGMNHTTDAKAGMQQREQPQQADKELPALIAATKRVHDLAIESGFEWTTIEPLINKAYTALKGGDETLARELFSEAKRHAELALEQAERAEKYWHLLAPSDE